MSIEAESLTPRRPYLFRAVYEWLLDNQLTPHLLVDATIDGVVVPQDFVKDGQITLNLAPQAIDQLNISNESVSFDAQFQGQVCSIFVPMAAAYAIFARENGAGTLFDPEPAYMQDIADEEEVSIEIADEMIESPQSTESQTKGGPHLTIVK